MKQWNKLAIIPFPRAEARTNELSIEVTHTQAAKPRPLAVLIYLIRCVAAVVNIVASKPSFTISPNQLSLNV